MCRDRLDCMRCAVRASVSAVCRCLRQVVSSQVGGRDGVNYRYLRAFTLPKSGLKAHPHSTMEFDGATFDPDKDRLMRRKSGGKTKVT